MFISFHAIIFEFELSKSKSVVRKQDLTWPGHSRSCRQGTACRLIITLALCIKFPKKWPPKTPKIAVVVWPYPEGPPILILWCTPKRHHFCNELRIDRASHSRWKTWHQNARVANDLLTTVIVLYCITERNCTSYNRVAVMVCHIESAREKKSRGRVAVVYKMRWSLGRCSEKFFELFK